MLGPIKRAPRACTWCHYRKVQCDAVTGGCPCTRCRNDGRPECILREKALGVRSTYTGFNSNDDASKKNNNTTTDLNGRPGTSNDLLVLTTTTTSTDETSLPVSSDNAVISSYSDSLPESNVHYAYFSFLEFRNSSLAWEEMNHLDFHGCLHVPHREALDEFVREYFLYVHPDLPLLDEATFWRGYGDSRKENWKISLFVFQALLFVSCSYVSLEVVRSCGFTDKKTARNAFYNRAKLLFDHGAEDRFLCNAQGALLLTHYVSGQEPRVGSLWLSRAIQNAMIIESRPCPRVGMELHLRKRLWLSIVLRDRSLGLGLRRRTQVPPIHSNFGELEEGDFEDEINNSQVYDPDVKRTLFIILKERCKLDVLLSGVMSLVFPTHAIPTSTLPLSSQQFEMRLAILSQIQHSLQRWEYVRIILLAEIASDNFNSTAQLCLAQYQALLVESHSNCLGENYAKHISKTGNALGVAVDGLTKIMEYFSKRSQDHCLPLCVLANIQMPLITAAIDFKLSRSSSELEVRKHRLDCLGEIIRQSSRTYSVTNAISIHANHILHLTYMIIHHLFLWGNADPKPSTPDQRTTLSPSSSDRAVNTGRTQSDLCLRNWHDIFFKYPRAYLSISASADYGLSVGKLPPNHAIPEVVRCIRPGYLSIRLPWATNTVDVGAHRHKRVSNRNTKPVLRVTERNESRRRLLSSGKPARKGNSIRTGNDVEIFEDQKKPNENGFRTGKHEGTINLDFFDLDANDTTNPVSELGDITMTAFNRMIASSGGANADMAMGGTGASRYGLLEGELRSVGP